ncbi:efflux RND transporter periplasmic adaptor subunit [bacterium]|nr:efflux RND transporter periplasmic adaptor subunit [bacterium]
MKRIVVAIISIALLGGIIFGMKSCFKKSNESGLKVRTVAVQRGNMITKVTETGSVQPKTTVQIKSNVGGEIVRLPVKEGDWVRKGDLLVELDTTILKNKFIQAKADLELVKAKLSTLLAGERPQDIAKARESLKQAEINLEDAKVKLDRQNGLFRQGFISKQDVDTAQRAYELAMSSYNTASLSLSLILEGAREQDIVSAKASVLKAEVSHEQSASDLKDATIYAPLDGTILAKNVEEGEKVTSGIGNSGGGTVILTIGDLSSMKILAKINEVDITKVKTGQEVEITLDAIRGEKYHGRVTDIASLGKIENNIVTYEVTIEILGAGVRINHRDTETQREQEVRSQNTEYRIQSTEHRTQKTEDRRQMVQGISRTPNPALKTGMTANVDIITDRKTDVLYVPLEAIVEHKGRKKILVLEDSVFVARRIKTGLQDETRVEIIEGLTEGEKVKLNSLTPKKEKTDSSSRSRMSGPPGMGRMH